MLINAFICIILIFFLIHHVTKINHDNLVLEKSTLDDTFYLVQNKNNKSITANKLAFIKKNLILIIEYLKLHKNEYPKYKKSIDTLIKRTKIINIQERPEYETDYTSYTINKGESIVFCLRSTVLDSIHDNNTLLYVAIHELAHVFSDATGHGDEFVDKFKFLLQISKKNNIYIPSDYSKNPIEYCGMTIDEYLF
jgi:hypothetical protein